MPMEGDLYTFLLSLILVACLLYWARDLGEEDTKTKKALKSALQRKKPQRRDDAKP